MKILIAHNHYRYSGGEDVVVNAEMDMLRQAGHEVIFYERYNAEYNQLNLLQKICFILRDIFWSPSTFRDVTNLIDRHKPDVAHVHNVFFFISPSIYDACRQKKIPIVQTLHNYRFLCGNGLFYREGKPCEKCIKTSGLSVLRHRCLQSSLYFSTFYFVLLKWMQITGIFRTKIDVFIAPSAFVQNKFIQTGLIPVDKLTVKPNFVQDDMPIRQDPGHYVVFAGAIADYKGVKTLLKAWEDLNIPLRIIGDGPLFKELNSQCHNSHVQWLGALSWEETMTHIRQSSVVVVPSECYETFSKVIIDAYSCGVPAIASDIGAVAERIIEGETGLLFKPSDSEDLRMKILKIFYDLDLNKRMGGKALSLYKKEYSRVSNYLNLINLYQSIEVKERF